MELSLDNILTGDDFNLFDTEEPQDTQPEEKEEKNTPEDGEKDTTEVNPNTLFDEPESVGSEDNKEDKEDTPDAKGNTSPKFYSSIAKAFAEEGIFPDLNDEDISKVSSPEDLRELIDKQIQAGLDERQKRIDEALNAGVEPDTVRQYENAINYLDSLDEDAITDESDKGENLRKNLIMQDLLNKGYSKERAIKAVEKSFKNGDDIEDAKEALNGNKEYFKGKYNDLVKEAKEEEKKEQEKMKEQAAKLKDSILTDSKVFGEIEVDKATRQKIYDNISKPIYKDPESGQVLTAIQKYEMENRTDFLKYLGLCFTLTNGFKNLDGLVKNKVKKEVKKGFRELERTINNTSRTSDGNLKFVSGVDGESFIGKGWTIDA